MTRGVGEVCRNLFGFGAIWQWAVLANVIALYLVFRPSYRALEGVFMFFLAVLSVSFLGSAIWAGKPLPEMQRFVTDNRDAMAQLPVAYFILCDLLREYTPANRQVALGYVAPLRKLHEPVSVGLFAGRRDFSKVHPLLTWVLKRVFRLVEGDFRDWEQIKA